MVLPVQYTIHAGANQILRTSEIFTAGKLYWGGAVAEWSKALLVRESQQKLKYPKFAHSPGQDKRFKNYFSDWGAQ